MQSKQMGGDVMTTNSSGPGAGPVFVGPQGKAFNPLPLPTVRAIQIALLLIVLLAPLLFMGSFLVYVQPGEFGVKVVKIGAHRGVHEHVYGPGYAFVKPFGMESMYRFPRTLQVYELSDEDKPGQLTPSHTYAPAANIQTSDGFFVRVDVTILYHIADAFKVMTTLGPGQLYLDTGIVPKVEPVLKAAFGELATEEFYTPKRVEQAEKSKEMLNEVLEAKGLKVEQVLVRYFKYTEEIQDNIEAKKLQDQLVFKNRAQGRAATEEAQVKRVTQEGEMKAKVTLQEGQAYRTTKDAERELFVRRREAQGDLLVKNAEAEVTALKSKAMEALGYDRRIAMEMAKALDGLDTIMIPSTGDQGFNPLNLEKMLGVFGVQMGKPAGSSAPIELELPPMETPALAVPTTPAAPSATAATPEAAPATSPSPPPPPPPAPAPAEVTVAPAAAQPAGGN
jgi:regulator of protease activity HflC (stomatin/prohibitin superfamily)